MAVGSSELSACTNCGNLQDQLRKQADEFKHAEQEFTKLKEALTAERNSKDNLKEELNAARRNLPVLVAPQELPMKAAWCAP